MSIDISEFEQITPTSRRGENSVRVEIFLRNNKDKAFTPLEIKGAIGDISIESVAGILYHLKELGIVIWHSPYYIYNKKLILSKIGDNSEVEK